MDVDFHMTSRRAAIGAIGAVAGSLLTPAVAQAQNASTPAIAYNEYRAHKGSVELAVYRKHSTATPRGAL